MRLKACVRSVLVLAIVGTFVSAQQISAESVFNAKGAARLEELTLQPLSLAESAAAGAGLLRGDFVATGADTVETFEVEIEEDTGPGIVKQLAVFAVITAIAGYAVYTLLDTDEETPTPDTGGKEYPEPSVVIPFSVPFGRLR